MKARDAERLRAWLADPHVADLDPLTVGRLRQRLDDGEPLVLDTLPHGTLVVREPPREGGFARRVLELDRTGVVLTTLGRRDDGALAYAWIKIADDSWVMVEPRAAYESPWGMCDRLWHAAHPSAAAHLPLTLFEALDYEAIDRIPVLLEPARLPAGAGAAVLNLIASLAADAGRSRLDYRGPYPTEQLFLALLESFRYESIVASAARPGPTVGDVSSAGPGSGDPLAGFMAGRLHWKPAPHERACPVPGVTVHLRGRIEKIVWRERLYYRPDWQDVHRHVPRCIRDADGAVACSLRALGEVVEDHLRLDTHGTVVEIVAPPPLALPARPLPHAVLVGIRSALAALGAAPLASSLREIVERCELRWASLDGELASVERTRLTLSHALREHLGRRLQAASTRRERLALGLAAVTEFAHLLGDPLRAQAQSRLATLPPQTQADALSRRDSQEQRATDARNITAAVESLIADIDPDHSQI